MCVHGTSVRMCENVLLIERLQGMQEETSKSVSKDYGVQVMQCTEVRVFVFFTALGVLNLEKLDVMASPTLPG